MRNYKILELKKKVDEIRYELKDAEELNIKRQQKQAIYGKLFTNVESLLDYRKKTNSLYMQIIFAMGKYKNAAIAALEQDIKNHLDLVLPDEDFHVKFDCSPVNGKEAAKLLIGRKDPVTNEIMYLPPSIQNGGLVKQVASISAVDGILTLLKSNSRYFDEALHSGDATSLMELVPLLMAICERGSQVISIEHRTRMLFQMPHRYIPMIKNRQADHVVVGTIVDSPGEAFSQDIGNLISKVLKATNGDGETTTGAVENLAATRDKMEAELSQAYAQDSFDENFKVGY